MENTIKLAGSVVSTSEEDGLYKAIVKVRRDSGVVDYLPITSKKEILGDIYLAGSIRTYSKDNHLHVFIKPRFVDILDKCMDQNEVELVGVICKKSKLRKTPLSKLICDFILAVNNGEYSYYIPCIAWGFNAIRVDDMCIGDCVNINGRLQSRNYTKENAEYTVYEVSCEKVNTL